MNYSRRIELLRNHPHYDSVEEGLAVTELEQGNHTTFIVRRRDCFQFHRCYWQRDQIVTQIDFSITYSDMWRLRREAAREIGENWLEEHDFPYNINEL